MPFFEPEFRPLYKPGDTVQIAGKSYRVREVRQAYPFRFKLVNLTKPVDISLKDAGLKAKEGELLHVRLRFKGPCTVTVRIEGAGGPVAGGYGGVERQADESVPENLNEFLIYGEKIGWLYLVVYPLVVPAWLQVVAYGYLYIVEETGERAVSYPPYIAERRA